MAHNTNIFELRDKFGINSPLGNWQNPASIEFKKDVNLPELIQYISLNRSPAKAATFKYADFQGFEMKTRNGNRGETYDHKEFKTIPYLFQKEGLFAKSRELKMDALINTKAGSIDFTKRPDAELNFNFKKEEIEVRLKYRYTSVPNKPNLEEIEKYAIIISIYSYIDTIDLLPVLHLQLTKSGETTILNQFRGAFNSSANAENRANVIDWLYEQAPDFVLYDRNRSLILDDLKLLLTKDVDEKGTNEEVAVLSILNVLAFDPKDQSDLHKSNIDSLLDFMITETVNEQTVFQKLFDKLDDQGGADNHTAFLLLMYKLWGVSKHKDNFKSSYNGEPENLAYESNKVLGFYHDDYRFYFNGNKIDVKKNSGKTSTGMDANIVFETEVWETIGQYDIFQPIRLPEVTQEGDIKLPNRVIPAFYLKAFDDRNEWNNFNKGIWLFVDVVTTFTGVGNLFKLRHLTKLGRAIKLTFGVTQLTSGTLGIILNFVNDCGDGTFCKRLKEYLFWVDVASLGLDAITERMLKKTAKDALDEINNIERSVPEEVIDHLEEVGKTRRTRYINNQTFEEIYEDLASGKIKRAFPDILSLKEEAALRFYTTNPGYKNFNQALRGEIQMTDDFLLQKSIMNRALAKLPRSIHNKPGTLLYRIENLTDKQIKQIYQKGQTITTKHFTSCTYSEEAIVSAMRNRPYSVLIRIEGKNGKLIEDISTLPAEKEIVFKTDTIFEVKDVGFDIDPLDPMKPIKRVILIEK